MLMKSRWCICVLANNMKFFHVMVSNITENMKDMVWIVFNDDRLADKTQSIENELINAGIKRYKVVKATEVNDEFKELVKDPISVTEYRLSMCLLFLWHVEKHFKSWDNMLYVDDDVVFTPIADDIFEIDKCSFFTGDGFMKMAVKSEQYRPLTESMIEMFDDRFDANELSVDYVSSCAFTINRSQFDFDKYERQLVKFFNDPVVFDFMHRSRKATGFHTDEMFLSSFIHDCGLTDGDFGKMLAFVISKDDKIRDVTMNNWFKRKYLIHIGNTTWKNVTYDRLIANGLVNV